MDTRYQQVEIRVLRNPLNLKQLKEEYGYNIKSKTIKERLKDAMAKVTGRRICSYFAQELYNFVPLVEKLRTYRWRQWIVMDMMAGLTVGMVHIPQSMGFALLTGVAPVYGLYSSFWPVLFYMMFGHCRHLSVGTMAVISIMLGPIVEREALLWRNSQGTATAVESTTVTIVAPLDGFSIQVPNNISQSSGEEGLTDEDLYRSSVASGVSFIASLTMLLMGILKLGVLTSFMPPSFTSAFTMGVGFHITVSQIKGLLNINVIRYSGMFNLPLNLFEVLKSLGKANPPDIIVTVISLSFLVFIKEFINIQYKSKLKVPIPTEMIVVILGTLISYLAQFNERWSIRILGFLPTGIPPPVLPNLDRADTYIIEGIVIGLTSFAISISIAEILVKKHKYVYNPNKELIAYGVSYGISSFFRAFVGAAPPPRCVLLETAGGKTQVSGFFSAFLLLIVLLVIGPLFRYLPNACLASIIASALIPIYKSFAQLPRLWRLNKIDLLIWIVTFLTSVILDLSVSLGVGIVFAIFASAIPSMAAKGFSYGITNHSDIFIPVKTYSKCAGRDDVAIFRYESTLHYLTINNFKKVLFKATFDPRGGSPAQAPTGSHQEANEHHNIEANRGTKPKQIRAIILDCAPIGYIDILGLDTLKELKMQYDAFNVSLTLACCNPSLLQKLSAAGLDDTETGGFHIFPTVQDGLFILSEMSRGACGNSKTREVCNGTLDVGVEGQTRQCKHISRL